MNNTILISGSYLLGLLALTASPIAKAGDFQFNGYISQSLVISEDLPFYDDESGIHGNFRELGITGSYRVNNRLRLSAQVNSRKAGDIDDGTPELDLLMADLRLWSTEAITAGVRLGRLHNRLGLHNITRDVPHGRVGAIVPQSVYFETFRDTAFLVDGAEVYLNYLSKWGDLMFAANYGEVELTEDAVDVQFYQRSIPGDFDTFDDRSTIYLEWHPKILPGLSLAYTNLKGSLSLEGAPALSQQELFAAFARVAQDPFAAFDYISSQDVETQVDVLSFEYQASSDWTITVEYEAIDTEISNLVVLGQLQAPDQVDSEAYYGQVEWAPSDKFSLFGRIDRLYYNKDDRDGQQYQADTGVNRFGQFSESVTLGGRWFFTPDFSIAGQYSRNDGFAFALGAKDIDYSVLGESWDLGIIQLSYHF